MERTFTVITKTENGTIQSPFRFCEEKAATLAMRMDNLTGSHCHTCEEVTKEEGLGLIAYEEKCHCAKPKLIMTEDGNICKKCGRDVDGYSVYDMISMVNRSGFYL